MTTEPEVGQERTFVRALLPWVIAAGALIVYLVTLNRWVSFSSLSQVARISGWTWQPDIYGPVFWLATLPVRLLPDAAVPLALNLFSAVCAALSLALLARSVALLPHDRTHEQRQHEGTTAGFLSIRAAWVPPVLAALVCGLQLTFWENATAASSQAPPLGTGCDMLDLLLFAYVLRCLLEFRVEERESWLYRGAFAFGVALTNNWGMIGFIPVWLVALVWIRGLAFFNLRFLGRLALFGMVGLSFYLLLPLVNGLSANSPAGFWPALKANLGAQRAIVSLLYSSSRHDLALLAMTSLLPVFIISIRWASYFGDTSKLGVALATFMFHVVHALFLAICIWVALDPPFSPRNKNLGSPFLSFYYLGAISIGYCSGYFLLLFSKKIDRHRRVPDYIRLINAVVTGAVYVILVSAPLALLLRNLPQIRATNGRTLQDFGAAMASSLPPQRAVLLSDDARRLNLLHAYVSKTGRGKDYFFLDTASLVWPDYHRFLNRKYPRIWKSVPPKGMTDQAAPLGLVGLILQMAKTNSIYYLHPSFGYYFEHFYLEPHGLVYKLDAYPTNTLIPPLPPANVIAENEAFWSKLGPQALDPLQRILSLHSVGKQSAVLDFLVDRAHLTREQNHDAATVASFYSRAVNYWGVEMQKIGKLTNAAAHFARALDLNPDNIVAQVNQECNANLQAGRKCSVQVGKSVEDEFGKYRSWDQLMGENGPFDEPTFCYEQGRMFVRNSQYHQAAGQFARVQELAPDNLAARIWLGQLYVVSYLPTQALQVVSQIRSRPELLAAAETNRNELLFVEASAHLAEKDLAGTEAVVQAATRRYPGDAEILAAATRVYLRYGRFSNAISTIEQELRLSPTNLTALVNMGFASIQTGAFEQAIPPLTKAVEIDANSTTALLNLAIACLRAERLQEAQRHYERLQKSYPTAPQIYYGLGEIAWRKKETNAAIRNYQLYLANTMTNTAEANVVSARLKQLKSGSR